MLQPKNAFSHRTSGRVIVPALVLSLVMLAVGGGGYWYFTRDLPWVDVLKDQKTYPGTKIYSDDNVLLGEIKVEKGFPVPLKKVPKSFVQAIVAVEDAHFFRHHGLDYVGMLRALLTNIWAGGVRQGGSTITQQLAKIMFLTPERTFSRKIREVILARRIEAQLTKEEILDLYLNKIYFGHGAYGIEMAAQSYFGKHVEALTLSEAAVLAGLPKAPNTYSPYADLDRTKRRQRYVLDRMVEEGYITTEEAKSAYSRPLALRNLRKKTDVAPYVVEAVRKEIEERYGQEALYQKGLKVYTTIDPAMQLAAVQALQAGLRELDKRHGFRGPVEHREPRKTDGKKKDEDETAVGKTVLPLGDVITGRVTAVSDDGVSVLARGVKGRIPPAGMAWALDKVKPAKGEKVPKGKKWRARPDRILKAGDIIRVRVAGLPQKGKAALFDLEQDPLVEGAAVILDPATGFIRAMVGGFDFGRSEFNRALHARRQAGSAFKPFVYAAAMDAGFSPASIIIDAPVTYDEQQDLKPGWSPENYDREYFGPTRLRTALAYSRNIVTIKLLKEVGLKPVIGLARQLGISGPLPEDLTLALGSGSATPLELTAAYASFANGGSRMKPILIRAVADANGEIIESQEPQGEPIVSPETSYLLTSMLQDVVAYGTGWRIREVGRPVAGKTGTTNDYNDAWFVGYTPNLAAGVWVGYDNEKSLGPQETGSRAASPIWTTMMKEALKGVPVEWFKKPPGITVVEIDAATGLLASFDSEETIPEVFKAGKEPDRASTRADREALEEAARKEFEAAAEREKEQGKKEKKSPRRGQRQVREDRD